MSTPKRTALEKARAATQMSQVQTGIPLSLNVNEVTGRIEYPSDFYRAKRSNSWLTYMPQVGTQELNTGSLGYTHHAMIEMQCHFDAVRIPLVNYDTASTQTYDAVAVSVGGDRANALNSAGAWVDVTFGGSASVTVPIAVLKNGHVYPGIVLSDPIRVASVDRTDGGTLPLLYVRVYMSTGAGKNFSVWTHSNTGLSTGFAYTGRRFVSRYQSGNFVASPASMTDNSQRAFSPIFGASILPRARAPITVAAFGDSITRWGTDFGRGWLHDAVQDGSRTDAPVDYCNFGVSSSVSGEFLLAAQRVIPVLLPQFAMWPIWTPNGGPSAVADMRGDLRQFLELCDTYRVTPILWTGTPRSTGANETPYYSGGDDAQRLQWIEDARQIASAVVVDTHTALSTTTAPAAYRIGMTTDGVHPYTDAGKAAMVSSIRSTLAALSA
jgi:hypothetical protein